MSELLELLDTFGLAAVVVYMLFRLENRLEELKTAIHELCLELKNRG